MPDTNNELCPNCGSEQVKGVIVTGAQPGRFYDRRCAECGNRWES